MALAMVLGLLAAGSGVTLAGSLDTAPGATIVVLAIVLFLLVALGTAGWRSIRRRSLPTEATTQLEPPDVVLDR